MTAQGTDRSAPVSDRLTGRRVDELVDFVLEQTTSPVNTWAVAATLESRGLRDVDARQRYGEPDVFALADRVYAGCRVRLAAQPQEDGPPPEPETAAAVVRRYARGLASGLPMLVQTCSVLVLAFVLYASLGYDVEQASAVALATMLSLVVTGGFVQCIGRLTVPYVERSALTLARQTSWRLVRCGLVVSACVGLALLALNAATSWLPTPVAAVAAVYFALLSCLWLLLAVLDALRLRVSILAVFALTTAVVLLVDQTTRLSLEVAHWTGLAAADVAAAAWAWHSLRRTTGAGPASAQRLPGSAISAYGAAPYFVYGLLYYVFLFTDRLLAWTVGSQPLPFWFDGTYELALDLALLVLVVMLPQLEYAVHAFAESITSVQKSFLAVDLSSHNRHYVRFYRRQLGLLSVLGAVAGGAVAGAVLALDAAGHVDADGGTGWWVLLWGTVGYALLVMALLNGVFLFSLSRPWPVVMALSVAVVTNGATGWALSRYGEHWWSVGGLVSGALVFATVTTVATVRVLRRLDYYYYAAY